MSELDYYTLLRNCKDGVFLREKMVLYALSHGVKPAARHFKTTPKTIRKWLNRYREDGLYGLRERSKRPKHSPRKISALIENKIVSVCETMIRKGKRLTASYIANHHQVGCSTPTICRLMHRHGFSKKTLRKNKRKKDMRAAKSHLKPLERIQVDVKYLDDIPEMFDDYIYHKLPRYQFTARDVRTGMLFVSYAREISVHNAIIFIRRLAEHFMKYHLNTDNTIIQTDNGIEFVHYRLDPQKSLFTKQTEDFFLLHKRIPIGAKTYQSDVEASHRLIEDEFYAIDEFGSVSEFLRKAHNYVAWFNMKRYNTYKKGTPLALWQQYDAHIDPGVCTFEPVLLDKYFDKYFECA